MEKTVVGYKVSSEAMLGGLFHHKDCPPVQTPNGGTNPKRCKSCQHFKGCAEAVGRRPMDVACREYAKRKERR